MDGERKSRRQLRDDRVFARAQELEELHALAQAAAHHFRRGEHLADDGSNLRGTEIEPLVEALDRLEDFGVPEVRIVERRDLRTVFRQKVGVFGEPAVFLGLLVEEGAWIRRSERRSEERRVG